MNNNNLFNNNMFPQQSPNRPGGWTLPSGNQQPGTQPSNLFGQQSGFGTLQNTFQMQQPTQANTLSQPQFGASSFTPSFPKPATPFGAATSNTATAPSFGSFSGFGSNNQSSTLVPTAAGNTLGTSSTLNAFGLNKPAVQQYGQSTWSPLTQSNTWNTAGQGSKTPSYTISRMREDSGLFSDVMDITAMKEYSGKAVDEIRAEDYALSRKPVVAQQSGFNSAIGQPSPFNSTQIPTASTFNSSFVSGAKPFSAPSLTATSPLQAQPSPFSAPSATLPPTPTSSLFQSVSSKPATSSPLTPQYGTSLFPSLPQHQPTTPGQWNSPATQSPSAFAPQTGLNSAVTNLFAQPSSQSLFNKPAASLFSSPFASQTGFTTQNANSGMTATLPTCDPYLISGIEFESTEEQKPAVPTVLPAPLFDSSRRKMESKLEIRPPKKMGRSGVYTIPEIKGGETIPNLVLGFEGKGKVEYLEPTSVSSVDDLEWKVKFANGTVHVSDPPGAGLNKRARVTVEGVFPYCRMTGSFIRGVAQKWPERGIQERFIYQLKNSTEKSFVDYDPNTGLYVYEVNHF